MRVWASTTIASHEQVGSRQGGVVSAEVVEVVELTLRVAAVATAVVTVPAVAVGYALARWRFPGHRLVSALVGLPLVLPPTAVGFLLLSWLAVDGPLGRDALGFDLDVLLTWKAAVLAAAVMSLPLVARTARVTFEAVDPRLEQMDRTLGHGPASVFFRVTLPLAARGLAAALLLGFTRALGEFGATVTLAGNIPGRTRTLASAIFTAQQAGREADADALMLLALGVGLTAIWVTEWLTASGAPSRRREAP
jgi:molybdate transport system permease protein